MKRFSLYLLFVLAACGHSAPAPDAAPTPQPTHLFGKWGVVRIPGDKDTALCYAGASPIKSSGSAVSRRTPPYLMVTKRKDGTLEVSASSGYPYMPSSAVDLIIDGEEHHLFFKNNVAWVRSSDNDLAVINSIHAGSVIEVRGVSADGKTSIDSYSPHGFWQAIAGIRELCP